MPAIKLDGRTYDARPDRVDLRDRLYMPKLVSVPDQFPSEEFVERHLAAYARSFILDQKKDGACTGFGLAALINYLMWKRSLLAGMESVAKKAMREKPEKPVRVSPWMLYRLARLYDEWPGEDYEGSSCRGAVKGWHRHGACELTRWSQRELASRAVGSKTATDELLADAATRPLGAYYRIDKDSISDMQAAIHEVGAIYVSADVHEGWNALGRGGPMGVKVIGRRPPKTDAGGHAFCIVGYTTDGFLVQNSWGLGWGSHGFALLPYEDWTRHAMDAWVAVMGAPVRVELDRTTTISGLNLHERHSGMAQWFWTPKSRDSLPRYKNRAVEPIDEPTARELTLIMGNDGKPINPFLFVETAEAAARRTVVDLPAAWMKSRGATRLAIYAHGGLNSEEASIRRIRTMAPYFLANGIYPIFLTWKTGVVESIEGRLEDFVKRLIDKPEDRAERAGLRVLEYLADAKDRAIEAGSERVLVKGLWSEMKQNASASAQGRGGLVLLAQMLAELRAKVPQVEFHAVGHSAGSILLGQLGLLLAQNSLKIKSCRLYAAACTTGFAGAYYVPALRDGTIERLTCDVMSDDREQDDSVGPYGKSLLYLVSRALEDKHKTPILGMERVWVDPRKVTDAELQEYWHTDTLQSVKSVIQSLRVQGVRLQVHSKERISTGRREIPIAHGTFDNDVDVLSETLREIRGGRSLDAEVESLEGF